MKTRNLTDAETIALRIAQKEAAANKNRGKVLDFYTQKPPKAPEPKRHETEITKYYQ